MKEALNFSIRAAVWKAVGTPVQNAVHRRIYKSVTSRLLGDPRKFVQFPVANLERPTTIAVYDKLVEYKLNHE